MLRRFLFSDRAKLFEESGLWYALARTRDSGQPGLLMRERPLDSKQVNVGSGVRVARRRQSAFVKGYRTPWTPADTDRARRWEGRRPARPITLNAFGSSRRGHLPPEWMVSGHSAMVDRWRTCATVARLTPRHTTRCAVVCSRSASGLIVTTGQWPRPWCRVVPISPGNSRCSLSAAAGAVLRPRPMLGQLD
jgi:hypothetical protein